MTRAQNAMREDASVIRIGSFHIVDFVFYSMDVFNRSESSNDVLLSIPGWANVHPLLKVIPVDAGYFRGDTLGALRLTWYSNIAPDKTVEITNYLHDHAQIGETVFYDIYTAEEKAVDPDKRDTRLFFFRGTPDAKFAVCSAGGGFAYVNAMDRLVLFRLCACHSSSRMETTS